MELAVEPQLQSYHGGDDAIRAYFQCGYSYRVIVQMLAKYEGKLLVSYYLLLLLNSHVMLIIGLFILFYQFHICWPTRYHYY